jgi:hypothetical protein
MPRCGDCFFWMKSSLCLREKNVGGVNKGPSVDQSSCAKFRLDPLYEKDVQEEDFTEQQKSLQDSKTAYEHALKVGKATDTGGIDYQMERIIFKPEYDLIKVERLSNEEAIKNMFRRAPSNEFTEYLLERLQDLQDFTVANIKGVLNTLCWTDIVLLPTWFGIDIGQPKEPVADDYGLMTWAYQTDCRLFWAVRARQWIDTHPDARDRLAEAIFAKCEL